MRCEDVLNRLNARGDGELPPEEAAGLDAHLAECSSCRAAAEVLETIDAELRWAFAPWRAAAARLAASVVATNRDTNHEVLPAPVVATPRLAWGQVLVAVAAGFLLAVALFRPWQNLGPADAIGEPIARLTLASGPVAVQPGINLPVFLCPQGGSIERGSTVRTGPAEQCEIALNDGNALRLDCNTEVSLRKPEVVEVNRGRMWLSCQPGGKNLEIQSGGGTIVAQAAELAVDCRPDTVRVTVVDGAACVQAGPQSKQVGRGKQVRIAKGKVEEETAERDALLETAWVNSLLALRGSDHPELAERVNELLANVGAAKLSLRYEDELRRLGDAGVPPLLAYLASSRENPQVAQRATAARIMADVAEPRWVGDLIGLLSDANADVRFHAARGLERLTGRDQGLAAGAWKSSPWGSCEGPHQKWLAWWAANRDRFPGGRRDIPTPTSPPF